MTFNWFVLGTSVAIGVSSGLVGREIMRRSVPGGLLAAALIGLVGTVSGMFAILFVDELELFGQAHLWYLVVTVSIPLTAALLLLGWRTLSSASRLLLIVPLLAAPTGLYATHIEPFRLEVDRVELQTAVGAGLRVGVFSDMQSIEVGDYENRAIDLLLAQEPDIILIPGDFVQLPRDEFDRRFDEFHEAMSRLGEGAPLVVAVNGNTDTAVRLRLLAMRTSVVVLDNEMLETVVREHTVRIAGISLGEREASIGPMLDDFFQSAEEQPVRIVLAHQPDEIARFTDADDIDLLVAGHTHGGQIAIPGFGPFLTLSDVPRSVGAGGLHELDGHKVYVSTGVGRERNRAPQVRFGVRPSVGIIEFVAAGG